MKAYKRRWKWNTKDKESTTWSAPPSISTLLSHWRNLIGTFGRFVRRGSKQSIARAAVNNSLLSQLVRALCSAIRKELKKSVFWRTWLHSQSWIEACFGEFYLEGVIELEQNAPTFLALLVGLLPASIQQLDSVHPVLCTCASILLKLTNQKVVLVQTVVSPVLKAGQTGSTMA